MSFSFRKHLSGAAAALVAILALTYAAPDVASQQRELPFRIKRDGSVNYEDLMKLTRQAPARDSITDEELAALKARHEVKYGSDVFKPTKEVEMPPRQDLYASSIILSDGVNHTLLPQRSVLFIPEKYQQRVVEEPVGKLILWPDFWKLNHSWIRVQEVSLSIAKGEEPIAEPLREQYESGFQVVVSQYRKSPISVMPLKEPEAETNPEGGDVAVVTDKNSRSARR